jgi:hypothetical protein
VAVGETPAARPVEPVKVSNIKTGNESISFDVDRVGSPVLVKMSYFPNWRASGADGPWRVAPNLMVVTPTSKHVTLTYGRTGVEWLSYALTFAGLVGLGVLVWLGRFRFTGREGAGPDDDGYGYDPPEPPYGGGDGDGEGDDEDWSAWAGEWPDQEPEPAADDPPSEPAGADPPAGPEQAPALVAAAPEPEAELTAADPAPAPEAGASDPQPEPELAAAPPEPELAGAEPVAAEPTADGGPSPDGSPAAPPGTDTPP